MASRRRASWQAWPDHWLKAGLSLVRGRNDALHEPLFQMPADELGSAGKAMSHRAGRLDVTGRFVRRQNRVATVFSRGSENRTPASPPSTYGANWRYAQNSRCASAPRTSSTGRTTST
jgi:hemoglobin/transferrin/lactoferrin receptor protein